MRKSLIFMLKIYSYIVSPFLGNNCRFYPSCSCYAETAINRFGVIKGSWLTLRRLSKCHPFHEGGIDLVPEKNNHSPADTSWTHNV